MSNYFIKTFKSDLESPEMTEEKMIGMMENTDFFLKVLRVKLESDDPDLQKQAIDELKEFKHLLETYQK
ncbi:MAG: hypothetical protein K1X28_05525 [Parachlamydiales bacterium]|nr:hypothetical protein [Parachlamydiales bacterium]